MGKVKILDESDRYPNSLKGTNKYYRQFFEIEKDEADCFAYIITLFYCLELIGDTRNHIDSIYNFSERIINTECLKEG